MSKKKAYSYLRISTPAQEMGDGVRRQIEGSIRYAQEHGYELVATFQDLGVSGFKGKNSKEGALGEILRAIEDGRIEPDSVLIVESLDRLSRESALEAFSQFSGILAKQIAIVTLMDGQFYTKEIVGSNPGLLFTSLGIMLRANEESETKSKRLKAAWERKRVKISERVLTEKAPAWLVKKVDGSGFEIDEEKAQIVREIFQMCIDGVGIYSIARILNSGSTHAPIATASRWNNSYISKILHNRATLGEFQPNRIVNGKRIPTGDFFPHYFPSIIDEDTFLLAHASLTARKIDSGGRKGISLSNLFTGMIVCGNCGGNLIFRNKGKKPKGGIYLRCHTAILTNSCDRPAWRYDEFEASFIKFVTEVDISVISTEMSKELRPSLEKSIAIAEARIKKNKARIEKISKSMYFEDGVDDFIEELHKQGRQLSAENNTIKSEISAMKLRLKDLEADNAKSLKENATKLYAKVTQSMSNEELYVARSRFRGSIMKTIERIEVINGVDVNPWEISTQDEDAPLSNRYMQRLAQKGLTTDSQISNYIGSEYGRRDMDKYERHYRVFFKSGGSRIVWPSAENSIFLNPTQLRKEKPTTHPQPGKAML
jgi:DNA invertase Pin-like site-specific DNA recombinase